MTPCIDQARPSSQVVSLRQTGRMQDGFEAELRAIARKHVIVALRPAVRAVPGDVHAGMAEK